MAVHGEPSGVSARLSEPQRKPQQQGQTTAFPSTEGIGELPQLPHGCLHLGCISPQHLPSFMFLYLSPFYVSFTPSYWLSLRPFLP